MDFSNYLFRSHSAGHIMTEPKGKSNIEKYIEAKNKLKATEEKQSATKPTLKTYATLGKKIDELKIEVARLAEIKDQKELSETAKKFLVSVYAKAKYNRRKDIKNKYITKGLAVEEESLSLYCDLKNDIWFKNEQHFSNEFIQGTPDVVFEQVVDLKSSWDIMTFLSKTVEDLDSLYYWQGQCYMALTGAKKFRLAYCLVDTPKELIEKEKRNLYYELGGLPLVEASQAYLDGCAEIERSMVYSDIPKNERCIEFVIDRNDEDIELLYSRIKECRVWLNEYAKQQEQRFINIQNTIE